MKRAILLLFACILMISFEGCKKKSDSTTNPLIGSWTNSSSGVTITVTFADGGALSVLIGTTSVTGTYSTSGNILTINTSDCSHPGTYSYSISGSSATITLISDDCSARSSSVQGVWTKK